MYVLLLHLAYILYLTYVLTIFAVWTYSGSCPRYNFQNGHLDMRCKSTKILQEGGRSDSGPSDWLSGCVQDGSWSISVKCRRSDRAPLAS